MKNIIAIAMLMLVMFAGCVSTPFVQPAAPAKEQVGEQLQNATVPGAEELIKASGNENVGVVEIYAEKSSGKWLFPTTDYNGQFETMGLYSSAFVMLNRTQIQWLGDGESIWLTPMISNGSGVLFNAVYENDAVNCTSGQISILGKNYSLSDFGQGTGFQGDDKWKIERDPSTGCPKRVIIYLDGYFYGLKDNETIPLFRNDNTILLKFYGLEASAVVEVIGTKLPEAPRITQNANGQSQDTSIQNTSNQSVESATNAVETDNTNFTDEFSEEVYNLTQSTGSDGMTLRFNPPVEVCSDYNPAAIGLLTEDDHVRINISGQVWVISKLENGPNDTSLVLAKEGTGAVLLANQLNQSVLLDGDNLTFEDYDNPQNGYHGANNIETFSYRNQTFDMTDGETIPFQDGYLRIWSSSGTYQFGPYYVDLSYLTDQIDLEDPANNVTVGWVDSNTCGNMSVSTIFVPRSSPIFANLTGNA